jgi:acyl-coenzyme A synthetase/AMP-(fatty) acid ligase
LTYAALVAAADRLAGHLAGNGLHVGDRVAVWLPSRVETAIALLACSRNAYVCCPSFHRDHRVGEVAALVERVRAAALVALPGYGADGDRCDVFAELAGRDFLHCWPAGAADKAPFAALAGPAIDRPSSSDPNQIMYLPFTSGTTGIPKGVMHSDNTLDTVLPPGVRARVSIEAGSTLGWEHYVGLDGAIIGLNRFGASAPGEIVMRELGFTPEHVVEAAKSLIGGHKPG